MGIRIGNKSYYYIKIAKFEFSQKKNLLEIVVVFNDNIHISKVFVQVKYRFICSGKMYVYVKEIFK